MKTVVVKRGRAKPLWRGHPWVYGDSIARIGGDPAPGDLVGVHDERGRLIGSGFLSPDSAIAVRLLAREEIEEPDREFFARRLRTAVAVRADALNLPVFTNAYRLVHSEGDGLPGLIVDHFAGHLAVQFSTVGMYRRREVLLDAIEEVLAPQSIHLTPDRKACEWEGIPPESGLLRGSEPGEPPTVMEHGVCFRVPLGAGQKTGFYCDQRYNRQLLGRLVRGRSVLDLHCYTAAFGLHAAVNGASEVTCVDSSGPALALAAENAMLNNCRNVRVLRHDVRNVLNEFHGQKRRFGVVISDPPRFAATRAGVPKALRAYRDLHLRAMRVVESGGLLAASSCSGTVQEGEFLQTLCEAAYDLGRELRVLYRGGQSPDHPVDAHCPEGRYLKFLLLCVH